MMVVLAGLVPYECCEGEPAPCLSPGFRWLLAMFDVSWLKEASTQSPHLWSQHIFPVCFPVSKFPLFFNLI